MDVISQKETVTSQGHQTEQLGSTDPGRADQNPQGMQVVDTFHNPPLVGVDSNKGERQLCGLHRGNKKASLLRWLMVPTLRFNPVSLIAILQGLDTGTTGALRFWTFL